MTNDEKPKDYENIKQRREQDRSAMFTYRQRQSYNAKLLCITRRKS